MISKGNELLQDLFEKLKGVWQNEGKYKGQKFTATDIKSHIEKIIVEYNDDTDIRTTNSADNNE